MNKYMNNWRAKQAFGFRRKQREMDFSPPPPCRLIYILYFYLCDNSAYEPPVAPFPSTAARQTRPYFYSLFAMIGVMGP